MRIEITGTICIVRDCDEIILTTSSIKEALEIMLAGEWITEKDKVRNPLTNEWTYLDELYGKNWKNILLTLDARTLEILYNNELHFERISLEKLVK